MSALVAAARLVMSHAKSELVLVAFSVLLTMVVWLGLAWAVWG